MVSALRGMVYLESKNVIHRDVAARNFLVRIVTYNSLYVLPKIKYQTLLLIINIIFIILLI